MDQLHDLLKDPAHAQRSLLDKMRIAIKDPKQYEVVGPFLDAQAAQKRLMDREKAKGERLAAQRSEMIDSLTMLFFLGIAVNIFLSVVLANYLMRNLTSRVQHVMENIARIVKREALDPPKKGADEIAYLDQVLFETGNHLIELERFKQALVAIVSHELRTPLMAVYSTLELLDAGVYGELSENGERNLKIAEEQARTLIRLINDLLDIEKMDAGKFVLDKIEFKIGELIEPTTAAVAPLAEAKQIKLELNETNDELILWADRDRLRQALINLLSTRIKFSPDHSTINFSVQSKSAEVEFRVIDHGGGIPEELRQKIFDRFVQLEKSDASERNGSGLALAITKAIVEQHGGTIGVDSEIGIGSTFWFKLPLNHADASANANADAITPVTKSQ
jgi:signal transduction histidine kinase